MSRESTRLRLRVSPGAARTEIVGRHGEDWKVRLRAPADGGRANEALLDLLAERLEIPRDRVRLVSGRGARDKVVELAGVTLADAERLLSSQREEGRA